jgi:hypothetical protein
VGALAWPKAAGMGVVCWPQYCEHWNPLVASAGSVTAVARSALAGVVLVRAVDRPIPPLPLSCAHCTKPVMVVMSLPSAAGTEKPPASA